jgi:TRAP-type uncharacterized transport system substrate-binding protein
VDALKDGKVDAFFWNGGLPTASILDLVNTPGITARSSARRRAAGLQRRYGQASITGRHPGGHLQAAGDVPVIAVANLLVVSETMPGSAAHDITKILFEQQPTLATITRRQGNCRLNTR